MHIVEVFKENRYDPETGTLEFTLPQAAIFEELRDHYVGVLARAPSKGWQALPARRALQCPSFHRDAHPQVVAKVFFPTLIEDGLTDDEHRETAIDIFLEGLRPEKA